jgi:hypothetical protein
MRASHIRGNEPFGGGASPGPPTPSVLDGLALLDESRPFRPRTPILMITDRDQYDFGSRLTRRRPGFHPEAGRWNLLRHLVVSRSIRASELRMKDDS